MQHTDWLIRGELLFETGEWMRIPASRRQWKCYGPVELRRTWLPVDLFIVYSPQPQDWFHIDNIYQIYRRVLSLATIKLSSNILSRCKFEQSQFFFFSSFLIIYFFFYLWIGENKTQHLSWYYRFLFRISSIRPNEWMDSLLAIVWNVSQTRDPSQWWP